MEVPPIRFARNGGVSLAYQTWGAGPDVVAVPPGAQNIELGWERREYAELHERLGRFSRALIFDKRGTGASDRSVAIPTLDERVEDLVAIMDDAGVARAHLIGTSEGGPVALAFAATYPERVNGIVLLSSAARIRGDLTPEQLAVSQARVQTLIDNWGTDETISLDVWAPSLAQDPTFRAWIPRYERQSASPTVVRELFEMIVHIDVRPLLADIDAPVLVLHRRDDPVLPLERAQEAVARLRNARLVTLEGADHWAHAGDMHAWMDEVEAFVAGTVTSRSGPPRAPRPSVAIRTMGGFAVTIDGTEVPAGAWGSRRARQLCKRLAVANGQAVRREELYEQLWPDESDMGRLSARLSVVLSKVRRVLGAGVVADRSVVRLDPEIIRVDLNVLGRHLVAGRDVEALAAWTGPLLPEDAYEDWASSARDAVSRTIIGLHRRLATLAHNGGRHQTVADHASAILEIDRYDEQAHELLVRALNLAGLPGEAVRADQCYRTRMAELGVAPRHLITVDGS